MTPVALAAAAALAQSAVAGSPSPERALALRLGHAQSVRRWDAASGAELEPLPGAAGVVYFLSCSPDGSRLAAALENNALEVWHARTGAVLLRVPCTSGVFHARWSRDGADLFALPMDDTVRGLRGAQQGE